LEADAGIDRVAPELDALRLELGLGGIEIVDAELERVGIGPELLPQRIQLHYRDRQVAGFELAGGQLPPLLASLEPEHLVVELHRPVDVRRADDQKVRSR